MFTNYTGFNIDSPLFLNKIMKMKNLKTTILFICISIFSLNLSSQISTGLILGGTFTNANLSKTSFAKLNATKLRSQAGFFIEKEINEHFSIRPSLLYTEKGFQLNTLNVAFYFDNIIAERNRYSYSLNYLELPVTINYTFKKLDVGLGTYFSLLLSGKENYKKIDLFNEDNSSQVTGGQLKTFYSTKQPSTDESAISGIDYGFLFSLAYQIENIKIQWQSSYGLASSYISYKNADHGNSIIEHRNKSKTLSILFYFNRIKESKKVRSR